MYVYFGGRGGGWNGGRGRGGCGRGGRGRGRGHQNCSKANDPPTQMSVHRRQRK